MPSAEHPPVRGRGTWFAGSRPHVHAGFLRSWQANGLNQKLLQRINDIAKSSAELPRHSVCVTGEMWRTACSLPNMAYHGFPKKHTQELSALSTMLHCTRTNVPLAC